ncbi:MAG: hypothetical protein GX574_09765 [Lentisphaerae bacterium]|nr:hypothetical protein [Lentisphaerota bacterium]OQC15020.1 MAG: hypothetical protein BWX73_01542 [Lentisphaerae bacterium ADurb.Bin082]HQL86694.1 hypothetical protein [Lentisphaeria bacterium]
MRSIFLFIATVGLLAASAGVAQNAYVATCSFTAAKRRPAQATSVLTITDRSQTPQVTMSFNGRELSLVDQSTDSPRQLLTAAIQLTPGEHQLRLWLSTSQTEVDLDGIRLGLGPGLDVSGRPGIAFQPGSGITAPEKPRLQKIAPIAFHDDFARVEATDEDSQWETIQGAFMVNMSRNPDNSQSAFQLWAAAPDGEAFALARHSHWFWQNLRYGVSVLPDDETAEWGITFGWLDQDNYHLFAVTQNRKSAQARLILVRNGNPKTLAETVLEKQRQAWIRADVIAVNGRFQAYLGGRQVLTAKDDASIAGRVGLYLNHTRQAFFDDVSVVSADPAELDQPLREPFGPCEQPWSDFSGKRFLTDPHMSQWAHPRSFWSDDGQGLYWFRSRLFHHLAMTWKPEKSRPLPATAKIILFASEKQPETGYCFAFAKTAVTLLKDNRQVANATIPEQISELTAAANGDGAIVLTVNGQACLTWQDEQPLRKGWLAADLGRTSGLSSSQLEKPDWRDHALVTSTNRLDYSFEHAPTAWMPQAGNWQGTHRWACVPKWSFFAGRGPAGPAETLHGNAILWNLRKIQGDFDLELFMAPLEGTPQRAHFSFPIPLNVAFGADGKNLDSGYNLVFGTYDVPSQLFSGHELLAENSDRILPKLRLKEAAWYHRMTQTWQHLRIQRRDGRILAHAATHGDDAEYQGLQPLFDVPAKNSDQADQFAVWTWGDNGLAIARATLSFQDSTGPAAPPPLPTPRTARTAASNQEPRHYVRYQNPIPGGQFATIMHHLPFNINDTALLTMLWRPGPNTRLSLLATVRDQCAEWVLTGPQKTRDYTIAMPAPTSQPHPDFPGWHTVTINFHQLKTFFPGPEPLVIEQIAIGSPYDSLDEIAGLGVNPLGAWMDVAFLKLSPTPPPSFLPAAPDWHLTVHGCPFHDDFEESYGEWHRLGGPDGAALLLDRTTPASGHASLRLLNQRVGGPAGAWITRTPFRLDAFPTLTFQARIPAGIEINLIVIANQQTFEIGLTGMDRTWPKIGQADGFKQDNTWQRVVIPLAAWLQPRFSDKPVIIEALALADSRRMSSYQRRAYWIDDFQLAPAMAPATAMSLHSANPANPVTAFQVVADNAPTAATDQAEVRPGTTLTLQGLPAEAEWLHITPHFQNGLQGRTRHVRIQKVDAVDATLPTATPPAVDPAPQAPYISYIPSDRLCRNTFEVAPGALETNADFGHFSIRREAWVLRNERHSATGASSAELVNLDDNGFCSIYLRKPAWDPQRWPCVAFDYMFAQPGCNLNLTLLVNGALTVVEWTGPNGPHNHFSPGIVGKTPYAKQDSQWHQTSFNLLEMLQQTRFAKTGVPVGLEAYELATWATRHHGSGYENPHDARVYFDNFTIFSEKGRDPAFEWKVPGAPPPIAGYSILFDQTADSTPPEQITTKEPRMAYHDVAPGQWFLHVRAVSESGAWGPKATCAITIRE